VRKECGWCGVDMGEVPGEGVEGVTTGICKECEQIERLKLAQHLVLTKRISWDEAKKRAFEGVSNEQQGESSS
jgi:hypothetical protein